MTRAVALALLVAAIAVGTVAFGSLLPDMPSLTPVDGFDGPTDHPVDAPTCEVIGCCDDGQGACPYCGNEVGS